MYETEAKLARARHHLADLTTSVEAYRARDPHTFAVEVLDHPDDDDLAVVVYTVRVTEPVPADWPLIVGDVLTNLRAALDYAVIGHASSRQTLTERQEKALGLPIIENADKWGGPATRLRPFLDPAVFDVIERRQPFTHTPATHHPLLLLNELVNHDKHRRLRVVNYSLRNFQLLDSSPDIDILEIDPQLCEMTNGAVLARLTIRRPPARPGHTYRLPAKASFGFAEELDVPRLGNRMYVLDALGSLADTVDVILRHLEHIGY